VYGRSAEEMEKVNEHADTLSTAASDFCLSKKEIERRIPVVTTLPGIYTIERTER
jgi:hypothetical protein